VAAFLVIVAIVAFATLLFYLPRAIGRGAAKVMFKNANAKAMDEIYTITSFTAPAEPTAVQHAVDEHLGLAHDIPPVLGKLHISEARDNRLRIALKSAPETGYAIKGIRRMSRPGRRLYVGKDEIPTVKNGFGIAIVSTSRGVMTGEKAKKLSIGGELLCEIW